MDQIKEAISVLKKGGVIAYPTDTIYGIGVDISNSRAVKKILKLKGRGCKKPLSVAVASFPMIEKIAKLNSKQRCLLKKYLPGPFTFVVPKKKIVPDIVTANSDLVGIRFFEHRLTNTIIKKFGSPIITTSANVSGQKEIMNYQDLKLEVDYIVKGKCNYKLHSTVVDLANNKILRQGSGKIKQSDLK